MLYRVHQSPWTGFELTTLVVMVTGGLGSFKYRRPLVKKCNFFQHWKFYLTLKSILLCQLRFPQRNDVRFYLQLFVGGSMSYLPPVVCRRVHVLFTSSCLQEGSCLVYLQLFVGGLMSCLPAVVCRRVQVLFTSSCL